MNRPSFPIFLRVEGKACLVVGGGAIAWPKARKLLEGGAQVTLVAPRIERYALPPELAAQLEVRQREFVPADLEGQTLVIAATDERRVQEQVRHEATARGIWCNVVDVPELCDFTFGAQLSRGALQVVIGTDGGFPLLAQRLRDRLETQFSPDMAEGVDLLAEARGTYQATSALSYREKRAVLAELLDEATVAALEQGDLQAIRARIAAWATERKEGPCSSSSSR